MSNKCIGKDNTAIITTNTNLFFPRLLLTVTREERERWKEKKRNVDLTVSYYCSYIVFLFARASILIITFRCLISVIVCLAGATFVTFYPYYQ